MSKVLRILLSLWGKRGTKICGYAAEQQKVRLIIVLGSVTQGVAGVRAVLIARGGSFCSHHWMFCLLDPLSELTDKAGRGKHLK